MKKLLSIILAILMIVTTIPFAFAADETPDFSDAKILTSDADGNLYIDGKVVSNRYIPGGKYKLGSDMKTDKNCFWIKEGNNVLLDLNGYTWDLVTNYLIVECELSVYDTSANESGKLVSSESTIQPYGSNKLNIYGGTIETTAAEQSIILIDTELNLYGGKIKSTKNAVHYRLFDDTVINLYGTVFECGENYGEFSVSLFDGTYAKVVLDVSDYTGDSLTVDASISEAGKIVIFEGIENAEAAENFKINYTINESYGVFYEKTEYDEATGEKSIYTANNAFTQQPSADNNLTVDFNNTAATFQWYEVEEKNLGTYIAEEARPLFSYDFKAGDVLKTSTDSELEFVVIEAGNEYIELMENEKTAITTFDADTTVDFFTGILDADNPVEINFTLINETKLDGETEKTLQKVECGKSYYCKATVGENVYVSDNVNILPVEHDLIQVDAQAPTCTEIGWEAYEYCTACDYTTYVEIPASTHIDANCDYKCDYNCGYVYETLDFSDAKVLTSVNGVLYIDGVEAETNSSKSQSRIYEGKYILEGDIETSRYIWILGDTNLDLNGYTWNLTKYINVNAPLSVYDTSEAETGKITSGSSSRTININDVAAGFNLYGGTIENTSSSGRCVLEVSWADVNLYAGKIKSNSQAIHFALGHEITLNIDGTVLESGDDYADVLVTLGTNDIAKGDIDVTDYKADSLTAKVNVISTLGKITVFRGIKNTQEAEKYQIIDVVCNESFDLCWEKTEYDEATGEKSIYTANNAFTQQPSVENDYTVDFNNPDVSFQWCEVEEKNLGVYTAEEFSPLFTYEFKAGDILKVSTDSEIDFVVLEVGDEYLELENDSKTAMIKIDADETIEIFSSIVDSENSVDIEFSVIKETALEGETGKTLQSPECGKSYYCKATVGENVYLSDVVTVGHDIVQADAKSPTCTEIGWDAYEYCTACDYSTYEEIPVDNDAHTDADGDYICDNGCGAEVVTLGGNVYPVDGDITNTGIYIGAFAAFDNCYKAGDGYMLIKGEGNNDTVMTLYNATIDVRGTGHKDAIKVDGEDIEIRFIGENNIFADEEAYITATGSNRHSQTFIGADDAVLNLYGNVTVSDINIESGTVNVYGADVNGYESVYVEGYLVISDGAVLNIISGDNGQGFNCGIIVQKGIVAEGEFNAIALTGVETDNEIIYNLTATGNAVLGADTYSPYYGMEIPEDMNVEVNFVVPEGASVTVPEGITLNLDSMTNVDIDGELIVYGTLICTHTGGEDTCDAPAVCDICKQVYGEKLTHTDEDGDYICDHGCGYEFEKPEEPTPDEPTEDTICEDCGKVHDGFFSEIICFFTRIFNFIKNLFA